MPKKEQLSIIQNILDDLSKGKTMIAKKRLNSKPRDNGLGMINIEQFLTSQQAGWVIKGTVARDLLPLVFSTNRPHIVPEFTP